MSGSCWSTTARTTASCSCASFAAAISLPHPSARRAPTSCARCSTSRGIYLPLTHEAPAQTGLATPAKRQGGTETILLVEDEPQVRALARGILTRAGYTVLEAEHGVAALELCERFQQPIQLVLTDVVMPMMSGRELVERLRTVRPEAKVLLMSGYTDDTIVHHGLLDRGVAYLQKPIMPETLTKKVREVLDGTA